MKKNKSMTNDSKEKKSDPAPNEGRSIKLPGEDLWRPLYPFKSHFMRIGGFSYHYIDEGPEDAKDDPNRPTLLMVHGNPTWSFYWRNMILAFRDRYRVIAVDHIGCGLSDKPSKKDYPYTLDRRINDMTFLIKKLNLLNIVLIAHDWGGTIGMGVAERNERRFSKIVLMNTGAFLSDACPLRIRICRTPILARLLLQGFNIFPRAALKMATSQPSAFSEGMRAGYLSPYSCWSDRVAVYQFVQDIPLFEKHRSYQCLKEIEEQLTLFREKPVSLIWGMQDWCFTSDFLKKFLQFFPEAEIHRLEKAGHYVVEDAAEEIVPILTEFILK